MDGVSYPAPYTFDWEAGSVHTISVVSPQDGPPGTRYVFYSWSDGGAPEHQIKVASVSDIYTANFTTQYSLTTGASPAGGGMVSPSGTNRYDSGQSVSISAAASVEYIFWQWLWHLSGSANPTFLIMNGPKSVTGQFVAIPETITVPNTPDGPTSGGAGSSYTFSTGGSVSNLGQGHSPEYRFD
ncbi:MAG: hypothetical protein HY882_08125 [Deltaproteobacteria bacterium]|nr:hypothetical protein [Deltaproteobacteria bacterium]